MEFTQWLGIAVLCAMGAMSPGLSFAVIVQQTFNFGRRSGVMAALAHGVGIGLYAFITVMGLSVILVNNDWVYQILRWLGILFLIYLAIKLFLADPPSESEINHHPHSTNAFNAQVMAAKSIRNGFLIAFLNPKVALFFIALFSQVIQPDFTPTDKSVIVATAAGVDAVWYSLVALGFSQTFILQSFKKYQSSFNRVFSAVLILTAVTFAISK